MRLKVIGVETTAVVAELTANLLHHHFLCIFQVFLLARKGELALQLNLKGIIRQFN